MVLFWKSHFFFFFGKPLSSMHFFGPFYSTQLQKKIQWAQSYEVTPFPQNDISLSEKPLN